MNNIDILKQTLNNNSKINNETKRAIISIIEEMEHKKYPVNYETLNKKLALLEVEKGTLDKNVIDYKDNKIIIDPEQIRYYDESLALTLILVEISRNCSDKGKITEPISIGFAESYAISLMGIDGIARYEEEQVISRMLSKMIGEDKLINIYFVGNMETDLAKELIKIGCDEKDIKELLTMIYENYKGKVIR